MESVWRLLFAPFKGILTDDGGNNYSHHTGSRAAHSESARRGETHDRYFPLKAFRQAELKRDEISKVLMNVHSEVVSSSESSESENSDVP